MTRLIGRYCTVLYCTVQVREYHRVLGWQPEERWPHLAEGRKYHACARIGDTVVVAGGSGYLTSTEVLNISLRTVRAGGPLTSGRAYFTMSPLDGTLYALAGLTRGFEPADSVERWEVGREEWVVEEALAGGARWNMAGVTVYRGDVCTD